ncbi:hypothetical protein DL767_003932 [Monosporascus sp. MG133]|nr:hypothetical protein DL767_003932 [Monosporascus sp. MG133]
MRRRLPLGHHQRLTLNMQRRPGRDCQLRPGLNVLHRQAPYNQLQPGLNALHRPVLDRHPRPSSGLRHSPPLNHNLRPPLICSAIHRPPITCVPRYAATGSVGYSTPYGAVPSWVFKSVCFTTVFLWR